VFFGNTSIGAEVAGILSERLQLPLVHACREVGGSDRFISLICGGKILAETELPQDTVLVTMVPGGYTPEQGQAGEPPTLLEVAHAPLSDLRVRLNRYIEPEKGEVDISKAEILIAIGRGIQNSDNIELAEDLAEVLGGNVCGSRPIVDQGWLPIHQLVGKSGKRVKPKIYIALGISGAPEHVEGITGSDTIIAVNTDPDAPIFNIAQFGAEADMLDVMEIMAEELRDMQPA